jgi:hypothetical protein
MSKVGIAALYLFYKIDRSTQSLDSEALEGKLTTGRIHSFEIRNSIFYGSTVFRSRLQRGSLFISFIRQSKSLPINRYSHFFVVPILKNQMPIFLAVTI